MRLTAVHVPSSSNELFSNANFHEDGGGFYVCSSRKLGLLRELSIQTPMAMEQGRHCNMTKYSIGTAGTKQWHKDSK